MNIVPSSTHSVNRSGKEILDVTAAQALVIAHARREYEEADAQVNRLIEAMNEAATEEAYQRLKALCAEAEAAACGALTRYQAVRNCRTLSTKTAPRPLDLAA